MNSRVHVTIACANYDRIAPIADGRVDVEGCDVTFVPLGPEEVFFRAFRYAEFDVSELSLNSYMMSTTRDACAYVAIPVYPSRSFRHSMIYVRADRGIETPGDLKGKIVGTPEYQQTANVWVRGMLEEQYGVRPGDMIWRTGGQEEPGRDERTPLDVPAGLDLAPIPKDRYLSEMFEAGEIDVYMSARAPSPYLRGSPTIERLFPDVRAAEQAYFRDTGLFPIMHLIGVKKSIAEAHPWLPAALYRAFDEAKALAMDRLEETGVLYATLPWPADAAAEAKRLMGDDFWPYGVSRNRHALETITRYSFDQGLAARNLSMEELFHPSTLDT